MKRFVIVRHVDGVAYYLKRVDHDRLKDWSDSTYFKSTRRGKPAAAEEGKGSPTATYTMDISQAKTFPSIKAAKAVIAEDYILRFAEVMDMAEVEK